MDPDDARRLADVDQRIASANERTEAAEEQTVVLARQYLDIIQSYPPDGSVRPDGVDQLGGVLPGMIDERLSACQPHIELLARHLELNTREPRDWPALEQVLVQESSSLQSLSSSLRVAALLVQLRNALDARGWL